MTKATGDGEIATNEEWRGVMKRARTAHKMSQAALAAAVGVSQAMINKIEKGESGGSGAVLSICRVLAIPAPMNFADEDTKHWHELGHAARRLMTPEQYGALEKLIESSVRQLEPPPAGADAPASRTRK
jgi:transcriptional regulator with XRE-family HTH domain